jgi:predicted RNA-binding protein YlxR (DUF448 family)
MGERMCAACRARAPRERLLRFVADADGRLWVDPFLKAPGRGAHLCYAAACVQLAVKRRAFQQAFKRPLEGVTLERLAEQLVEAQRRKVEALLSLGRRRGAVASGLNLLEGLAASLRLVLLADDISEQSAERLRRQVSCPVLPYGDGGALGATQGKERRVALGVTEPALAAELLQEINRGHDFGCILSTTTDRDPPQPLLALEVGEA